MSEPENPPSPESQPPSWVPNNQNADKQIQAAQEAYRQQGHQAAQSHSFSCVVVPYEEILIEVAQRLLDEGKHPTLPLIVAVMACEIRADRVLSRAFASQGLAKLGDAFSDQLRGSVLSRLPIFNAVTGLQIQQQPFWSSFQAAVKTRNNALHRGAVATSPEAKEAIEAASAMVAFLK
jgi:hypothetical protein